MSELGRPFGLKFDADEEKQREIAPGALDIGKPIGLSFGETVEDAAPVAVEPSEPAKAELPAVEPPGPPPRQREIYGDLQADRKTAASRADYQRAQAYAIAAQTMARDAGHEDRVFKIARELKMDTEAVRTNFLDADRMYHDRQVETLPPMLRDIARKDRTVAEDMLRNPAPWLAAEDEVGRLRDAVPERDRYDRTTSTEALLANSYNYMRGAGSGMVKRGAGIIAAPDFIQKAGELGKLKSHEEIDKGFYKPGPTDSSYHIWYARELERRIGLDIKAEEDAAVPMKDRPFYSFAESIRDRSARGPTHNRYQTAFDAGEMTGGIAFNAALVAANPLIGPFLAGAGELGAAGFDAMDRPPDGDQTNIALRDDRAAQMASGNIPIALFGAVPGPNVPTKLLNNGSVTGVIKQYASDVGVTALRLIGESVEGGLLSVGSTAWQNSLTNEVYGRNGDVLHNADISFLVGAIWRGSGTLKGEIQARSQTANMQLQKENNLYVAPQTLVTRHTQHWASEVQQLMGHVQGPLQRIGPHDRDDFINGKLQGLGKNASVWVAAEDANRLVRSGKLPDTYVAASGIRDKAAEATWIGDDVQLPLRDLVNAGIRQQHIDEVVGYLKFSPNSKTAREAGQFVRQEERQLDDTIKRLRKADLATVDGSYAFRKIRQDLSEGGMSNAEAERQAALRVQRYAQRLEQEPAQSGNESIDSLYARDRFRTNPQPRKDRSAEQQRSDEDDFVKITLNAIGRGDAGGRGNKAVNGEAMPGAPNETLKPRTGPIATDPVDAGDDHSGRRPSSPRSWDYPATLPAVP